MAHIKMKVAVHLLLIKNGEILLLRRFNTGYEDGKYTVVAGHVDGNEEIKAAMQREAREEAGITINDEDIEIVQVIHRKASDGERIDYFLTAKKWQGEITNVEPHKCDDLSWFNINKLPDNTIEYIRFAINNYQKGIKFSSYGFTK